MNRLIGRWVGETASAKVEEVWLVKLGTAMIGTFRQLKADGSELYEFQMFKEEKEGEKFLYLRHFDEQFLGWEEKDSPMKLRLAPSSDHELVFENTRESRLKSVNYHFRGDTLNVEVKDSQGNILFGFDYKRSSGIFGP